MGAIERTGGERALIYARVSSDEQAEAGYGLSVQIARCREYAERKGYTLVGPGFANVTGEIRTGVYQEDYTGRTAFRPAMNALLDDIEAFGVKHVIVHRTDRLGRLLLVQELLEKEVKDRGAYITYVSLPVDTSTDSGETVRLMLGLIDQIDYKNIIRRLHEHRIEAVKQGSVVVARPPYGYRVVEERNQGGKKILRRLEINEDEAQVVRQIFEWYLVGDESGGPFSAFAIAAKLTEKRIPTRGDTAGGFRRKYPEGVWSDSVFNTLLRN